VSFLSFLILSFIVDSGGRLGVRSISLAVVFLFLTHFLFRIRSVRLHGNLTFSFVLLVFVAMFWMLRSSLEGVAILSVVPWVLPCAIFPVFGYFFSRFRHREVEIAVISSAYIFSLLIVCVFVLLLCFGSLVTAFFYNLEYPGWFYVRSDGYPQVYFQSTLCLVVFSLYAYLNGYVKSAVFFSLILLVCLSRFGALTVVTFILLELVFGVKLLAKYCQVAFLIFVLIFLPACFALYVLIPQDLDFSDASLARFGHLVSIFDGLDLYKALVGSGPGTSFYTKGFSSFANNIEVSQLEVFRKYGLIGYGLINFVFYMILKYFYAIRHYVAVVCLCGFYFVAYSNPVLMTFIFSIFVGIFIADKNRLDAVDCERKFRGGISG